MVVYNFTTTVIPNATTNFGHDEVLRPYKAQAHASCLSTRTQTVVTAPRG